MPIHPTAIIDKRAEIDPSVEVGAYAIVEAGVKIGAEVKIYPHAYIAEGTTLGQRCQIHPFAVVGHHPQDLKWEGAPSYTQIGDATVIREGASVHRGAVPESTTIVGQRVYMMATAHVGHNCVVGDDVILANGAMLGGHVQVGRRTFVGGDVPIHQFVRVGELGMLAGGLRVISDVPPFMLVGREGLAGPNVVGLRRAGFSREERLEIRAAYKTLFRSGLLFRAALEQVAATVKTDPGRRLIEFLRAPSKRGIMGFRGRGREAASDIEQAE